MQEYHKIHSIFKRDEKGKFLFGDWSCEEFQLLKDIEWVGTEKVDGTNIRVMIDSSLEESIFFRGKTDKAEIPVSLKEKLVEMFPYKKMDGVFPRKVEDGIEQVRGVCLYGEGYGPKIQKGGGNYRKDVSFVLFDVKVGRWWFKREDVESIGKQLEIDVVPVVYRGNLDGAIKMCQDGFKSTWGDFEAEGLVLKPRVELGDRAGRRIVTKVKLKDFR